MEKNIPDEVRAKLAQWVLDKFVEKDKSISDAKDRIGILMDEVSHARIKLADANKEIERLKGLMVKAFNTFRYTPFPHNEPDYEDFAKENKI